MASSTNPVALVNRALLAIGGKYTVSSITPSDGSPQANAAAILFTPTFEQLGRTAWWNCLQKQIPLTLLAAAAGTPENPTNTAPFPPQPWLYQYAYPTDCLKARAIIPSFPAQGDGVPLTTINNAAPIWIRGMGQIPFKVAYATDAQNNPITVILTNQSQAQLAYNVNQQNPVIWDSQLEQAFVSSLAVFLVPALSMNAKLMETQIALADRLIGEARASDGNEGSNSQDHVPDWIRARSGGAAGSYDGSWGSGGYDNMCWPSAG